MIRIFLVFIVIVIFIYTIVWYKNRIYGGMVDGIWISTDEFNKSSEISGMILKIDENQDDPGKNFNINIYGSNNQLIHTGTYPVTISTDYAITDPDKLEVNVSGDIPIMDDNMSMTVTNSGSMVLLKNDNIYFEGIRI